MIVEVKDIDAVLLAEITKSSMQGNKLQYNRVVYISHFSPDDMDNSLLYDDACVKCVTLESFTVNA